MHVKIGTIRRSAQSALSSTSAIRDKRSGDRDGDVIARIGSCVWLASAVPVSKPPSRRVRRSRSALTRPGCRTRWGHTR